MKIINKFMYIKLKLTNVKERHIDKINKDLYEAKATDFEGKVYEKVTLWKSDWATPIIEGIEIVGEVKDTTKNPAYPSLTVYPEKTTGWGGGKKQPSVNISKLMDKKAENIAEAQGRKNDSISYFNSLNCAINFIEANSSSFMTHSPDEIFLEVLKYRDRFLAEWHKYEADPTKGKQPF